MYDPRPLHLKRYLMADWIIKVVYVTWGGREKTRFIAITCNQPGGCNSPDEAVMMALASLRKSGRYSWELPPKIKDCEPKRRFDMPESFQQRASDYKYWKERLCPASIA